MLRLDPKNTAEWFSFKISNKKKAFSKELYPPFSSGNSSIAYDAWAKGTQCLPLLSELDSNG